MQRLLEIMQRLRDPEHGCPWDVQQNFATIAPFTIEEAYEQFGDELAIYIDAGAVGEGYRDAPGNPGSTIVDASGLDAGKPWRVVRHGVIPWEDIQAVAGGTWQP